MSATLLLRDGSSVLLCRYYGNRCNTDALTYCNPG